MTPLFLTPLLSPIGYDADGDAVWPALGGRDGNNGMEFLVDDLDEESDDFDDDDEGDDDEDDRDSDDDDEGDDEDEGDQRARRRPTRRKVEQADEGDDDWEPPTREQWSKVEAALARNNGENRKLRLTKKIMGNLGVSDEQEFRDWLLDRGIDPETGTHLDGAAPAGERSNGSPDDGTGDGADDKVAKPTREQLVLERRRAEERGAAREAARFRPAVVQFAAAAALKDAGYSGKNISMALRLLNTDEVEVEFDDNGEVTTYGLDDQVEAIKNDFPELFVPKRADRRRTTDEDDEDERPARRGTPRKVAGGGARQVDGGDRGRPAPKKLGWLEQADRQLRGLSPTPRGRR